MKYTGVGENINDAIYNALIDFAKKTFLGVYLQVVQEKFIIAEISTQKTDAQMSKDKSVYAISLHEFIQNRLSIISNQKK